MSFVLVGEVAEKIVTQIKERHEKESLEGLSDLEACRTIFPVCPGTETCDALDVDPDACDSCSCVWNSLE